MWEVLDLYVEFKETSIWERFVKICDISQISNISIHTYLRFK
jgi:hypothetical protein